MITSSKVPPPFSGNTLIEYLSSRFSYLTREEWGARIRDGAVRCNHDACTVGAIVKTGDTISYDMGEFEEPPADFDYRIVYEDDWLLGVNKTGNLLVHRCGKSVRSNLIYQLRYVHLPRYPQAGAVNRLDSETSGVVLVAKDPSIVPRLQRQFAEKKVRKEYLALVHGYPRSASGSIDFPIGRDKQSSVSYRFCAPSPEGKPSLTDYQLVRKVGARFSLVALTPHTGRTHQLRVHLAAIGNGIVGDKLYGLSEKEFIAWRQSPATAAGRLLSSRQALHCARVVFNHPFRKCECRIEAPLPDDFSALAVKLETLSNDQCKV